MSHTNLFVYLPPFPLAVTNECSAAQITDPFTGVMNLVGGGAFRGSLAGIPVDRHVKYTVRRH